MERPPSETHSQFHVAAPPPASIIITNVDEPLRDSDEELNDIKLNEPVPADQDNFSIKRLRIDTSVVSTSHTADADGQPRASARTHTHRHLDRHLRSSITAGQSNSTTRTFQRGRLYHLSTGSSVRRRACVDTTRRRILP